MVRVSLLDVAAELLQLHVYQFADLVHLGLQLDQPRVVIYVLVHLLVLPRPHRLQPREAEFCEFEGLLAGLAPGEVLLRVSLVLVLALLAELSVVVAAGRPADRDEGEAVLIAASLGHLHPTNYKYNNGPHHYCPYDSCESCHCPSALSSRFTTAGRTWKFSSSTTSPLRALAAFLGLYGQSLWCVFTRA